MEVYKLGIKLFGSTDRIDLIEFIPIFHEWIQKQIIDGHLLIDVHNYSHIHEGPGILLVAHEGNFSINFTEGRIGFMYYRKQPFHSLADIVKPAVKGCGLLSDDRRMRGRLKFSTDEALVFANDRLVAPNTDEAFAELQPRLAAALKEALGKTFELSRATNDPKERLTIRAKLN